MSTLVEQVHFEMMLPDRIITVVSSDGTQAAAGAVVGDHPTPRSKHRRGAAAKQERTESDEEEEILIEEARRRMEQQQARSDATAEASVAASVDATAAAPVTAAMTASLPAEGGDVTSATSTAAEASVDGVSGVSVPDWQVRAGANVY